MNTSESEKEQKIPGKQNIKEKWVSTLSDLIKQLKQWTVEQIKLWEADPDQDVVPVVIESQIKINEEQLGKYYAPKLIITEDNYLVEIYPVGRFAIGPIGRVEMTNGKHSFHFLYSRRKGWSSLEKQKPLDKDLFLELLNQMFLYERYGL